MILGITLKVAVAASTLIVWVPKADAGTRKLWTHDPPDVLTVLTETLS